MADYIKIKRVKLIQSCIATAVEGNQIPEEWEDIEEVKREIEKVRKKTKGRSDEDNVLEGKMTQDHYLLL